MEVMNSDPGSYLYDLVENSGLLLRDLVLLTEKIQVMQPVMTNGFPGNGGSLLG